MPTYLDRDVLREARASVFDDTSDEIVQRAKRALAPKPPAPDYSLPDIGGLTSLWGKKPAPPQAAAGSAAASPYALPSRDGLELPWLNPGGAPAGRGGLSPASASAPGGSLEGYIRQAAARRGIDPDTAVAVARSEGLDERDPAKQSNFVYRGQRELSFGPFQLNINGGLGNAALQQGIDPRNPADVYRSIDFALDQVAKGGWEPFHGAATVGIGPRDGIGTYRGPGPADQSDVQPSPSSYDRPAQGAPAASLAGNRPTQFAAGLSWDEAVAACGLAAAAAFVKATGRTPTVREARDLATSLGVWDQGSGMHGAESEVKLLNGMGIAAHTEKGIDWAKAAQEVGSGNPVMFDTTGGSAGHYYTIEGYDPKTGMFDLGTSATDLKAANGRQWFRPDEIQGLGFGSPYTAIYMDNPLSPTKSPNAILPPPPAPPAPPPAPVSKAPAAYPAMGPRPVRQTIERDDSGRVSAVVDHHDDGAVRREIVRDDAGRVSEVVHRPVTIEQTPEALDAAPQAPDEMPADQYPMMAGAI